MNNALISALIKTYRSGSECAAALGMTRQAFNAATNRGRLSTDAALHAAALLNLEPGAALLANATATPNPAPPVINPGPTLPQQPAPPTLYYVNYRLRSICLVKATDAIRVQIGRSHFLCHQLI